AWTRTLQRFANLFTDRLLANCEAVKQVIARDERFPAGRIDVIYNGVDAAFFAPQSDERQRVRRELNVRDDELLVGNISTLRPVKGVETFVDAAAEAYRQESRLRFVIVGDGPMRPQIEEQIERLGLRDVVRLAGSQENVRPYLWALDVGVLSSESEGF